MKSCPGQLVVHRDGTVAYCTEKNAGRPCAGEDRPHRGGFFACRVVDGNQCRYCTDALITSESEPAEPVGVSPITLAPA
jgi:hypothetical protein